MEAPEILWKDIMEIPTEPTKIDETLLKDLIDVSRERFNSGKVTCIVDPCDLASV